MTETVKSLVPTRKWIATQVTAASGWLIALIQNGWELSAALQIMAVTIVAQALIGYLVSNENTPAGVPRKRSTRRSHARRSARRP